VIFPLRLLDPSRLAVERKKFSATDQIVQED
jgi:hypothetical protein